MFLLKKRVFPVLLCLLLLITAFTLPLSALVLPSVADSADAGLSYYKSAFEAGYEDGTYKADVWTQLIRRSAGKLDDADFAFLSPQVDVDDLLTVPAPTGETPNPKLDAHKIAKGVVALLAQGKAPGDQNVAKLVKALVELQDENGAFGDTAASTAMSLVALRCAGYGDFDLDKAVSALASEKFPGGGYNDFDYMATGSGAPESTAFVIMGLAAADTAAAKTELASAIAFLKSVWRPDGFFLSPADSETNTCIQATVLLALVTAGEDVTSDAWKKNGVSIADTILAFQDTNDYSGGFWYSENARNGELEYEWAVPPDQFTNYQVLLGLYAQLGGSPLTKLFREFQTTPAPVVTESSKPAPQPNPPTGDPINPIVWVVLIVAVIAVIVVVLLPVIRKKK